MADQTAGVRIRAADIIEPHLDGDFKRRDRAEGNAADLCYSGLLACHPGTLSDAVPVQEQVVNVLQCRLPWKVAERIAADLAAAGLLNGGDRG